ncbi:MAG: tRNA lysidine(34) synthetase TilS [Thiotrichaceae bacterium]|nr:tRNA lysidine(34) synthetase TilS [Thiotrichaceae bacterium]PCI13154.1 MAG: tRNA lysidine(34) synthetase TilS [Thiotrichales bacterium]
MTTAAIPQLLTQLGEALRQISLNRYPTHRYWIAFSGGIDSHVLLHAMATLRPQLLATLNAVHVNHGLNPKAAEWAAHAVSVCDALDIPCHVFNLDARAKRGESPEAAARDARYQAFSELIETGDVLLTAHHREDQAETLLLQLVRGAGPHGLAAMPLRTAFSNGHLARPLLAVEQALINHYAQEKRLEWLADPSNQDLNFERNFLRHEVMPALKAHWPALSKTVSRSAAHCAEAAGLLDELALEDLKAAAQWRREMALPDRISLHYVQQLSLPRRKNLLRFWIKAIGFGIISSAIINQIETSLISAKEDAMPLVSWAGGELRRHRGYIYVMPPLVSFDTSQRIEWAWHQSALLLPAGLGTLQTRLMEPGDEDDASQALHLKQCQQLPMTVRFRRGGERCQLPGRRHRHALKGLLQQAGVPPWQRNRIPLIYLGDQLAAVVGYFSCAPFLAQRHEPSVSISMR